MFRRNGSPSTGERVSNLQTLLQDIRDTERLRSTVGDAESDNVQRQLGNLLRVPFEEFQGKYVRNPMSGEIEPMSGPLTGTVVEESKTMMSPDVETIFVIDRREGSETFGMEIPVPRNMETYEMIRSGMFEFDEIAGMADGGEMKSDAVGIADGLDVEEESMTVDRGPSSDDGIAKVSPEKYVQLMNEVRGDEVPLEGRVQELATKVGEKDAQDTPLSVLALVQPVFELEEQGGIAQTQEAQQMMPPMASEQLANPQNMGIVRANTGLFADLSSVIGPEKASLIESLSGMYNLNEEPVDVQQLTKSYASMLGGDNLKDQAYLTASPLLLQLGATALNPEASLSDVISTGALGLQQFGTEYGKQKKAIDEKALALAMKKEQDQQTKKKDFLTAMAPEILKLATQDPGGLDAAIKQAQLNQMTIDNLKSDIELNYWDEKQSAELQTTILNNQQLSNALIYQNPKLANELKMQNLEILGKTIDNSLSQIELAYASPTAQAQLDQINANLQLVEKEIDIFDTMQMAKIGEMVAKTKKIEDELNNPKQDWEKVKIERTFMDKWNKTSSVELANERDKYFNDISGAVLGGDYEQLTELVITDDEGKVVKTVQIDPKTDQGARDIVIMFSFMKMNDPDSVVREGEQLLLRQSSGVFDQVSEMIDNFTGGAFLGDEQRLAIYNQAKNTMASSVKALYEDWEIYSKIAQKSNLDPELATPLRPFTTFFDAQPDFFRVTGIDPKIFNYTPSNIGGTSSSTTSGSSEDLIREDRKDKTNNLTDFLTGKI
jgi:hypothetical protein